MALAPLEHLVSLRAIPGLVVLRPGDTNEVFMPVDVMQLRHQPTVLAVAPAVAHTGAWLRPLGELFWFADRAAAAES